jgi:hypothetical protein
LTLHSLAAVPAVSLLLIAGTASASAPAIGMASAPSGITLDNSRVSGNATLFDGSTVQTEVYSRIKLNNGTRLDLGAGSKAQIFANRVALENGMSEAQSSTGYEIDTRTLKIQPSDATSIARVLVGADKAVLVTALNAPVNVLNRDGLLVARVAPGMPLSFMPQAGGANSFSSTGCVLQKSGAAILVDDTGNQVFELRGSDLRKAVGNKTMVTGTIDSSATAAGGASQVVKVTKATITSKGGCTSVATKLGATTAAVGLAAGVAGATAGGVAVGAAAGAAGAAAAIGVSTTVLVVGGVAAATAVGLGAAAAAGSFSSTSP